MIVPTCLRTVWLGQAVLAVGGLIVLASAAAAPVATILGALGCATCGVRLHRQLGSAPATDLRS